MSSITQVYLKYNKGASNSGKRGKSSVRWLKERFGALKYTIFKYTGFAVIASKGIQIIEG